jgi:hypothetical protein
VQAFGVGGVPFQLGRDLLLVDEHRRCGWRCASRPSVVPGAHAHVDHGLAGLEAQQHVAQAGGTGLLVWWPGRQTRRPARRCTSSASPRNTPPSNSIDELPMRAQRMPTCSRSS